ncbi:MAG: 4'-phosphopantetheinyl transferase superfamily protein [Parvularculaceae bacterium]
MSVAHAHVGVDVERLDRELCIESVARDMFSPRDQAALFALSPRDRRRRFIELWTLRESYAKARGLGLAFPFNSVSFSVDEPIGATFEAEADDVADRWRFAAVAASPSHLAAVAVKTDGAELSLRVRIVSTDDLMRPAR